MARKKDNKMLNNGYLCIAKTTLLPYKKHLNVLDVDFGNGVLVMLIVPQGLPMVCVNDLLKLDGLGEVKNHELVATNYKKLGRLIYPWSIITDTIK